MEQMEERLIKKAQKGDVKAFDHLLRQYEQRIYAIAFKVFKNEPDAYDVAQEIAIKVYSKIDQFRFESAFGTWLHRLAMNTAIDEYRKMKRKMKREESYDKPMDYGEETIVKQYEDPHDTPEEAYLRSERVREVWTALDKLKEDHRTIIVMKDIEDKAYQEISDLLDINIGTVKSRLARARLALKEEIQRMREQNGT